MIRTGRLNSLSLGIIFVRDLTMDRKSSFKRKKGAGAGYGIELTIQQRHELTSDIRVSDEPPDPPPVYPAEEPVPEHLRHKVFR
jgi:hypothetical protein